VGTLKNNGWLSNPLIDPPAQTPAEKEISDAKYQVEIFRRRGNLHGWKQAKAHLDKLLKKQRRKA